MGDTLAGMIAGFAGQFKQASLYERVVVATHLHSAIAQELAQEHYVVLPTQISSYLPKIMKKNISKRHLIVQAPLYLLEKSFNLSNEAI